MNRKLKFRVWNGKNFVYNLTINPSGYEYWTLKGMVPVSEKYIQQYTGVKDVDGKEIYEGDILLYGNRQGIVNFVAGMFVCDWTDQTDDELGYMETNKIHIVGNIFEKNNISL